MAQRKSSSTRGRWWLPASIPLGRRPAWGCVGAGQWACLGQGRRAGVAHDSQARETGTGTAGPISRHCRVIMFSQSHTIEDLLHQQF